MAQEQFTDVQPIQQQAKQPEQEQFTDVTPVQTPAPSTASSTNKPEGNKPEGWRPPIQRPEPQPGMLDKIDKGVTNFLAPKGTDYDTTLHTELKAVPKTLGRETYETGKTALGFIPGIYHAFADEATPEEKAKYADFEKQRGEAPGTETSGLKRVGLGMRRMLGVDATENAIQDYSQGKVSPEAALSVAPEAIGSGAGNVVAGETINAGLKNPALKRVAAAPVRVLSRAAEKVAPVLPHALGYGAGAALATEAGIPHPFIAGTVGGAIAGKLIPPEAVSAVVERGKTLGLSPEEASVSKLEDRATKSEKEFADAQKEVEAYKASKEQGVEPPEDVQKKFDKAKAKATEDRFHADVAKERLAKANQPEQPITVPEKSYTEGFDKDIDSLAPRVKPAEAAPKPAPKAINVKGPGEIQPETFPQEQATPNVNEGATVPLARNEGLRVGRPKLLPAENPVVEAPKQEVLPPEKPAKVGKPERGNVRALTVDEKGNVIDKEETPEGRVETLLRKGLEPEKKGPLGKINVESLEKNKENQNFPEAKVTEQEAKAPREQVKTPERSPEAKDLEPAVHEQVANLSDENLKKLAKAHGLEPDTYDFKARDEGRHRVDRDQLVKDITAKMGDDEVQNIARNSQALNSPDTAGFAKADRAARVFPRLRGEVDKFGNPKVSGGSQGATPALDTEADKLKEHVAQTSSKDTDHVQQALKELGPNAKLSDVMRKAQELKDAASTPEGLTQQKPGEATNSKGEKLTHEVKEGQHHVETTDADGNKIGEVVAKDIGNHTVEVVSNQIYDKNLRGEGRGTEQMKHLLRSVGDDTKTVKSDISTSDPARKSWDKLEKQFPEAVHKTEYKDGQVQYTVDMKKYREPIDVAKGANDYNAQAKLPKIEPEKVEKDARAAEIADDYQKMKHEPNDPYVKKSYKALVDDVKKQWDYATKKLGIDIVPTDVDPYKSYDEMRDDVQKNKQMKVWRGGNPLPEDHPLAKVDPKTGENYNTMFRAVHDIFGHVAQDHDFSEPGEERAWNVHRQMMDPEAVPAMTTETRGQTSWFFNNEGVRGGEPLGKFADQKAGLLPEYANERTPEAGKTLDHIKSGKDFAVLTAENPNNTRISDAENAARNRKLVADLREKGYKPVPVEGNTKDVEGQKEHSFFVPDISPKDAADIGRNHGQAAILTKQGLHDLNTDKINPSDNAKVMVGEEARKQPYYSRVGDQDFSVPIDFSKEEPAEKRGGTERRTNEEGPQGEERRVADRRETLKPPAELGEALNRGERIKTPFDVTEGANETIKRDTALPKHPSEDFKKPEASMETARMSDGDLLKAGFTREQIRNGEHLPTVGGGSQAVGAAPAKVGKLPKLAEENLSPEEKAGVTKSQAGRDSFVNNLMKLPSVKEVADIAKAGEGGKEWYQRSTKAFDHLMNEAPRYFKEADRKPFLDFIASLSPQQSVAMNLREALHTWTQYVDEGRPTGKALEKLLKDNLTLPGAKVPNTMKALSGQPLWPDLSKNTNFKVPSFGDNLSGDLDRVTNDGWMALFHGLDAKGIAKPTAYHAASAVTRAAADALGWKPAEAQAAIWAFTKVLTEKGETEPSVIRQYSEDFADIMKHDPETRQLLQNLGVDLGKLDAKLKGIGPKPKITPGASPTTENSIGKLAKRIETARGKGTIPPQKSGYLGFGDEPDEAVEFNPKELEENESLTNKKKNRLGKATR